MQVFISLEIILPRCIRRRSNLGHIFREKKCVLWAGKYGMFFASVSDFHDDNVYSLPVTNSIMFTIFFFQVLSWFLIPRGGEMIYGKMFSLILYFFSTYFKLSHT